MAYTLVMLGTGTEYTPNPNGDYKYGETLSFIASKIRQKAGEQGTLPKSTGSVRVVEGPNNEGSNVGNKISKGLIATIKAIGRGETTINMLGHSRGAVEAHLIAHELQRIQDDIKKNAAKSLIDILKSSPCDLTKAEIEKYLGKDENLAALTKISDDITKNISKLEVNFMAKDPVPGEGPYGTDRFIKWEDRRFYSIPKCVNHYHLTLMKNERTNCFRPILPHDKDSETHLEIYEMPGHHGTLSGRLGDQIGKNVPNNGNTEHAQQLTVCKLYDFLCKHDTSFNLEQEARSDDKLYGILKSYSQSETQNLFRLNLYKQIKNNIDAYNYFNNTHYYGLGYDPAHHPRPIRNAYEQQQCHLGLVVNNARDKFVNMDHALLFLGSTFNSDKWIINTPLEKFVYYISFITDPTDKIIELLNTNSQEFIEKRSDILSSIESISKVISNRYLNNLLPEKERLGVISCFDVIFNINKKKETPFIISIKENLINSLIETTTSCIERWSSRTDNLLHLDNSPNHNSGIEAHINYSDKLNNWLATLEGFQREFNELTKHSVDNKWPDRVTSCFTINISLLLTAKIQQVIQRRDATTEAVNTIKLSLSFNEQRSKLSRKNDALQQQLDTEKQQKQNILNDKTKQQSQEEQTLKPVIDSLKNQCKDYMDYALAKLDIKRPQNSEYQLLQINSNDCKKVGELKEKYKIAYDINKILNAEKSPSTKIQETRTHLEINKEQLKSHRDNIFIQFIGIIRDLIKACIPFIKSHSIANSRSALFYNGMKRTTQVFEKQPTIYS